MILNNMKIGVLLLFLLMASQVSGQDVLEKVIADDQTGAPVSYAYVQLTDNNQTGTLSNTDGLFRLQSALLSDTLMVSHIGYHPFKAAVSTFKSDTIFLEEKTLTLEEVPIYALDDVSIFKNVMERLDGNHTDEKMVYDVMLRSMTYREDHSVLHTLTDYSLEANYKSSKEGFLGMVKVNPERARVGRFSTQVADKSIFPHIDMLDLWEYQIFSWKLWKKSTPKKYDIRLTGTSQQESRSLLHLQLASREDAEVVTLFIDEETFAVVRKVSINVESGIFSDIRFKEVKGIWYLSYCVQRFVTSTYSFDPGHPVVLERVVLYELAPEKENASEFYGYFNITGNNWEDKITSWNDPFWGQFNHIPHPAWITEIVSAQPQDEGKAEALNPKD